ncbi:MAG: hypothetical protein ACI9LF_002135, partial [Flavobacteriales bacterium]
TSSYQQEASQYPLQALFYTRLNFIPIVSKGTS